MANNKDSSLNPNVINFPVWAIIAIVTSFCFANYYVFNATDKYHCGALLQDGQFLDNAHTNWQPDGCMMHTYNSKEISSCLSQKRVVLVGDSTVRQLYYAMVNEFDAPGAVQDKHTDISKTAGDITFDFIWDPFLNMTKPQDYESTGLLILGGGLWYLRHPSSGGVEAYSQRMSTVIADLKQHQGASMLLPVEDPVWSKLNPDRAQTIHKDGVDEMNAQLVGLADKSSVNVAFAFNKMVQGSDKYTEDGLHYDNIYLKTQVNVAMNFRCNNELAKKAPFDRTCCVSYPWPNHVQFLVLTFFLVWIPVALYYRRFSTDRISFLDRTTPTEAAVVPFLILGLAVVYMFFGDRTNIFLKVQKQYDAMQFGVLCLVSLAAGAAFLKKADKDQPFLNRDQTDEWKGWMQIAILIYHYLGASKISGIYNPIRVLVASYLFMTGFGHFTYFYKKGEFGFARIANTMVRLNLLTVFLMYAMDTDYLSYYFSPLVSMWFLIIWFVMWAGHQWNKNAAFLLIKLVVAAGLVHVLIQVPGVLEGIFSVLSLIFNIKWNASEWRFRVALDLWIVFGGMLFAYAFIKFSELKIAERDSWPNIRRYSIISSVAALVWYFYFELTRENKFVYNAYHPYISIVPILGFVILRNATPFLRMTTSKIFIFVGHCSLETFIIQFHVWLANDTKGLLMVLPPRWRFLNFVITTIIFIYISHHVAKATGTLTAWFCKGKQAPKQTQTNGHKPEGAGLLLNGEPMPEEYTSENATTSQRILGLVSTGWNDVRIKSAMVLFALWMVNLTYS